MTTEADRNLEIARMKVNKYFSFLICHHDNIINVYYNGVPIGVIQDGVFTVHHYVRNGLKIPMVFEDLPQPCPFNNFDEIGAEIANILDKIELPSRKNL